MQSLSSMFGEMTGGETSQGAGEASAWESDPSNESEGYTSRHSAPQDGFHASASAYQDINRTPVSYTHLDVYKRQHLGRADTDYGQGQYQRTLPAPQYDRGLGT